jgi:hypothetical protein
MRPQNSANAATRRREPTRFSGRRGSSGNERLPFPVSKPIWSRQAYKKPRPAGGEPNGSDENFDDKKKLSKFKQLGLSLSQAANSTPSPGHLSLKVQARTRARRSRGTLSRPRAKESNAARFLVIINAYDADGSAAPGL